MRALSCLAVLGLMIPALPACDEATVDDGFGDDDAVEDPCGGACNAGELCAHESVGGEMLCTAAPVFRVAEPTSAEVTTAIRPKGGPLRTARARASGTSWRRDRSSGMKTGPRENASSRVTRDLGPGSNASSAVECARGGDHGATTLDGARSVAPRAQIPGDPRRGVLP